MMCYCKIKGKSKGRRIGGVEVYLHAFLTLALDGGEWSTSRNDRVTPGVRAPYRLDRRLGELQSRSGSGGEEKNS